MARNSPDQYLQSLDSLVLDGCFGGSADDSLLSRSVRQTLNNLPEDMPTDSPQFVERRDTLLGLLLRIEGSLTESMTHMDTNWRSHASITMEQLQSAKTEISDNESIVRATFWDRHPNYAFFEGPVTGEFLIVYEDDIRISCPDSEFSDSCQKSLSFAADLTRHVALVQQILRDPVRRRLAKIHQELTTLDAEWDYFFEEARSQFWWEFIANNVLYDPPGDELAKPPHGQLILFHPRAAVEYVSGGLAVERAYNLIGVVEVIGYNRLRWNKDGPYSQWPLGFSIVASYIPATPGDDWGYGFMLHVRNRYSLGVTRRDTGAGDETTWVFSVDLNRLFLAKSEEARALFKSLD
jgi:hypothetical protein